MKVNLYEPPKNKEEAIQRIKDRIEEVKDIIRKESNPSKLWALRQTLQANELMLSLLWKK